MSELVHDHDHDHGELGEMDAQVRALESILSEKGYIDPPALDAQIETHPPESAHATVCAWWHVRGLTRNFTHG